MDYLKYVGGGQIQLDCNVYAPQSFDTHGLMARIKPVDGTVYIASIGRNDTASSEGAYPIAEGDAFDFVGCIRYYGTAKIEYLLFDKA